MMSDALQGALLGSVSMGVLNLIVNAVQSAGKRCDRVKSLCFGLATELETLWAQHTRNCGDRLMAIHPKDHWTFKYPLFSDYFTNYQANAADLGDINDPDLRSRVVRAYTELKGFMDSFRQINKMLDEPLPDPEKLRPNVVQGILDRQHAVLAEYTQMLQGENRKLNAEIPKLVNALRNHADIL